MPTLKDLGNGFNQVAISIDDVPNPMGQTKEQLGLVDLMNRIQQAPFDLEAKKAEAAIKGNQANRIDILNERADADFRASQATAQREQAKFINDQILNVHKGFQQSFQVGDAMLQNIAPGAQSFDNKDGTVSVVLPGNKAVKFNPNKITDPKIIADLEENRRDDWQQFAKGFGTQSEFFKKLESASTLGTAQGDISVIFSYMKILDPNSTVREGEAATAQNSPGVPERVRNMFNRALTVDAPFFGPVGSLTRKNFIDAAKVSFDSSKDITMAQAKNIFDLAPQDNLSPQKILGTVGGIDFYKAIVGQQQGAAPALTDTVQPQKTGPIPAGFNSTGSRPGMGTAPQPTKSLNDILSTNLLPKFKRN